MFCSETCQQDTWKRFHKYECPVIDGIFAASQECPTRRIAIRTAFYALTMFDDPDELRDLIKEINVETETAFDLDYSCLTEPQHFREIYALATKDTDISFTELLGLAQDCASTWHVLSNYTDLRLVLKTSDMEDLFLNLLFHFMQSAPVYSHEAYHGTGFYALCSLVNHSCAPNVARFCDGMKNVLFVRRMIKAGEQLFDNYGHGQTFFDAGLWERQSYLKSQYHFDCKCEACVKRYPLIQEMTIPPKLYQQIDGEYERICSHDREFAKKKLKEYKKFLISNYKKYPCYEVCAKEENLMQCLLILLKELPLEMKLKPLEG